MVFPLINFAYGVKMSQISSFIRIWGGWLSTGNSNEFKCHSLFLSWASRIDILFLFCALEESHFHHENGVLFYSSLPIYPQFSALGRVGPQERNAQWRDELINIEPGSCYHFSEVKSFLCIIGLHLRITARISKKTTTFN